MPQALGYCVSVACLIWLLHGYPIKEELIPAIKDLDWKWIILAVLADLSVYVIHGWRWKTLLGPVIRLRFWRTVQAIFIGLFANEVLPLRTGELIRCYLLAHWNDLRLSLSFASAAVERLIDGVFLVAAFLVTLELCEGRSAKSDPAGEGAGRTAAVRRDSAGVDRNAQDGSARRSGGRAGGPSTMRHVIEGLHLMGNLQTLGATTAISLLYFFLQVFSVYALMKADEMDLSLWAAFGILAVIRLGTVVPNAPGNLGLLNAACVTALHLFDVETNVAKTFSIIMFAAWTLPLLLAGAVAVAQTGLNIGELRDRAKDSGRRARQAPAREPPAPTI